MQLQDLLIDRFVEHREATAAGQEERVKIVEGEIDGLLAERLKSRNGRLWARPSRPQQRRSNSKEPDRRPGTGRVWAESTQDRMGLIALNRKRRCR